MLERNSSVYTWYGEDLHIILNLICLVVLQILRKLCFFNQIIYLITTYLFNLNPTLLLLCFFLIILLQELIPIKF